MSYLIYNLYPIKNTFYQKGKCYYIHDPESWDFQKVIGELVDIHGNFDTMKKMFFVHIREDIPNRDEICKTVLKIARETFNS